MDRSSFAERLWCEQYELESQQTTEQGQCRLLSRYKLTKSKAEDCLKQQNKALISIDDKAKVDCLIQ